MIAKTAADYRAYRISPGDTNRMVLLWNPLAEPARFVMVIEVFDEGGRTPPNSHQIGQEMFYVLSGNGIAHADGKSVPLRQGDTFLVQPRTVHEVENTGSGRLYCLTLMVPDDDFAKLILSGEEVAIDDEDRAVIAGAPMAMAAA